MSFQSSKTPWTKISIWGHWMAEKQLWTAQNHESPETDQKPLRDPNPLCKEQTSGGLNLSLAGKVKKWRPEVGVI